MRSTSRRKTVEPGHKTSLDAAKEIALQRLAEIVDHMMEWLAREDVRALHRVRLEDEVQEANEILQGLRRGRRKRP